MTGDGETKRRSAVTIDDRIECLIVPSSFNGSDKTGEVEPSRQPQPHHANARAAGRVLIVCAGSVVRRQLSALLGKESVRVLRQSGGSLDMAGGGDEAGKEPVDSVTLGRAGLVGEEEEARVMPVLRLAVVKDDQVRG